MSKRLTLAGMILVGFLAFSGTPIVFAHNLAVDGKISAFMHIAPNDKPQAGKANTIHFYINDQDFRFTMEGCDCKVKVNQGKKVLYSGPLPPEATRVGKINVFLPADNFSYGVKLSGTPKTAGFFQPFKLSFDIDAGHPPLKPIPNHKRYVPAAGMVLTAGAIGCYQILKKRHKIK